MKRKITLFIAFAALSGTALVAAAFGAQFGIASARVEGRHRRAQKHGARQRSGRHTRPYPLPVQEGQAGQERLLRRVRNLLAAALQHHEASSRKGRARLPAGRHQAGERQAAGDIRGSPPLPVHRRQECGPDGRRRPDRTSAAPGMSSQRAAARLSPPLLIPAAAVVTAAVTAAATAAERTSPSDGE